MVPEAAYEMAAEKAAKGGAPVPSLAEFKVALEKMQRKAKEYLKANLQKYSSTYGELSPTEAQYQRRKAVISQRAPESSGRPAPPSVAAPHRQPNNKISIQRSQSERMGPSGIQATKQQDARPSQTQVRANGPPSAAVPPAAKPPDSIKRSESERLRRTVMVINMVRDFERQCVTSRSRSASMPRLVRQEVIVN